MNPQKMQEIQNIVINTITWIVSTLMVLWPVIQKAAPWVIDQVVARMPDKNMARATAIVSNAALIGSGHVVNALHEAILKAQDPGSDGGKAITNDEWRKIIRIGVEVAWTSVRDQGPSAMRCVASVYGSHDAAKNSMSAKITGDALKTLERLGVEAPAPAPEPTPLRAA